MKIETILYLLPLVFMLHDFEEILMMKTWLAHNAAELQRRFPRLAEKMLPHFSSLSTSAFALAVAEEFVLISIFSVAAVEFQWYAWWAGLLLAFFLHLLVHMGQFLVWGKYIPTVVTSLPAGLYCIWALQAVMARTGLDWKQIVPSFGVMTGMMLANLWAVHRLAVWFEAHSGEHLHEKFITDRS
jgi:hypothetical protein